MRMKPKGLYLLHQSSFESVYDTAMRAEIGELLDIEDSPVTQAELADNPGILESVEIIMSSWGCPVLDANLLKAAPKLKAIFYGAGSIRGFVTEEFWDRNIVISSAYAANAIPVAEYTVSLILFSLKSGWQHVFDGRSRAAWPQRFKVPGAYRTTIGLISFGMIARHVYRLLKSFDVKVVVYDPFLSVEEAQAMEIEKVTLDELFECSNVVSLHTPLLPETVGMITESHFARMKKDAAFINTARGAIVDEPGMIHVLSERPDIYALLDVTHPEPPVKDSALYTLPNVVLTPHIAGSMDKECSRMGQYMLDELKRYLADEQLHWQISRERAATLA